jgi:hypothetical protein
MESVLNKLSNLCLILYVVLFYKFIRKRRLLKCILLNTNLYNSKTDVTIFIIRGKFDFLYNGRTDVTIFIKRGKFDFLYNIKTDITIFIIRGKFDLLYNFKTYITFLL